MIELSPVTVTLENQQQHGETVFPYALCCQKSDASLADAISWMNRQKTDLLDLATQHGAVLLRDFPVSNAIDFDAMVCAGVKYCVQEIIQCCSHQPDRQGLFCK